MWITPAFAQDAATTTVAADPTSNMLLQFGFLIPIFAIMYFLIIRPQRTRMKQQQEMVRAVRRGDTVVTAGGLVGKVSKVIDDSDVQVEIAEGVRVRVSRAMISDVRAKGEPVKEDTAAKASTT